MISLPEFFQTKIQKYPWLLRSMDGKQLMFFQSETSVFKFLRSVDEAYDI